MDHKELYQRFRKVTKKTNTYAIRVENLPPEYWACVLNSEAAEECEQFDYEMDTPE